MDSVAHKPSCPVDTLSTASHKFEACVADKSAPFIAEV